jgi:hypothetical protein
LELESGGGGGVGFVAGGDSDCAGGVGGEMGLSGEKGGELKLGVGKFPEEELQDSSEHLVLLLLL